MGYLTLAPGFPVGPLAPRPPRGPCEQDVFKQVSRQHAGVLLATTERENGQTAAEQFALVGIALFQTRRQAAGKVFSFILFAQSKTFMRVAHA